MNSLQSLMGMVLQEAIEWEREYTRLDNPTNYELSENLPPIRFDIELLERPDGSLYWVE